MDKERHPHSALIDQLGKKVVRDRFGVNPSKLYAWRRRGIPVTYRISFAKLAAEMGTVVPQDFMEDFAK